MRPPKITNIAGTITGTLNPISSINSRIAGTIRRHGRKAVDAWLSG